MDAPGHQYRVLYHLTWQVLCISRQSTTSRCCMGDIPIGPLTVPTVLSSVFEGKTDSDSMSEPGSLRIVDLGPDLLRGAPSGTELASGKRRSSSLRH